MEHLTTLQIELDKADPNIQMSKDEIRKEVEAGMSEERNELIRRYKANVFETS